MDQLTDIVKPNKFNFFKERSSGIWKTKQKHGS